MRATGVLVAVAVLAAVGCAPKPDVKKDEGARAGSATIVVMSRKEGLKTYLVSDAKKMAALEGFFPDYQKRPQGNTSVALAAGCFVYFDLPGGESVKVIVSHLSVEKPQWSVGGRGDFAVQGDFAQFLTDLENGK